MSTSNMKNFLQRMLRKNGNEELNGKSSLEEDRPDPEPATPSPESASWVHKLGDHSPKKYHVLGISPSMTVFRPFCNTLIYRPYESSSPPESSEPSSPAENPNLASIVRPFQEFGNGVKTCDAGSQDSNEYDDEYMMESRKQITGKLPTPIFECERTLIEDSREPRERQESSYDDRCNCSTSSSTSLMSITEALLQEEISYFAFPSGINNVPTFNTFHPRGPHDESAKSEVFHNIRPNDSKEKLILAKVPREQLENHEMPLYVCPVLLTMPLDWNVSIPQNPPTNMYAMAAMPQLPEHPHLSVVSRSCTDNNAADAFCYSASCSSSENIYDVPRRFREPTYDIPRRHSQEMFHCTAKPIDHHRDLLQSFLDDAASTKNTYPF